jgi:hypothetical protein
MPIGITTLVAEHVIFSPIGHDRYFSTRSWEKVPAHSERPEPRDVSVVPMHEYMKMTIYKRCWRAFSRDRCPFHTNTYGFMHVGYIY